MLAADMVKNALLAVPGIGQGRDKWRLRAGYDADKDQPEYVRTVYDAHCRAVTRLRPISGTVLEIGPGGNVGVALLFLAGGAARAICLDVFPWARDGRGSSVYRRLVADPEPLL